VLDRAAQEAKARMLGEVAEVLLAPGVRELVQHGHLVAAVEDAQAHERGADEAGAAAHEKFHARACIRSALRSCALALQARLSAAALLMRASSQPSLRGSRRGRRASRASPASRCAPLRARPT